MGRLSADDSPGVLCGELLPQQYRFLAHSLLDDPGALDHGGYELEDTVPALVCFLSIPLDEPAHVSVSPVLTKRGWGWMVMGMVRMIASWAK